MKHIACATVLTVLASCARSDAADQQQPVLHLPHTDAAGTPAQVVQQFHSFGRVVQGSPLAHEFSVTYRGRPVSLDELRATSCSAAVAFVGRAASSNADPSRALAQRIGDGDAIVARVSVNDVPEDGPFRVTTNLFEGERLIAVLELDGTIEPSLRCNESDLQLGCVPWGGTATARMVVSSRACGAFELHSSLSTDDPSWKVELRPIEGTTEWVAMVSYASTEQMTRKSVVSIEFSAVFSTASADASDACPHEATVRARASVKAVGSIYIPEDGLAFGPVTADNVPFREFMVVSTDAAAMPTLSASDFTVRSLVEANTPVLALEVQELSRSLTSARYRVRPTFAPDARVGSFSAVMRVRTSTSVRQELELPLFGIIVNATPTAQR